MAARVSAASAAARTAIFTMSGWIPDNTNELITGDDGGVWYSHDAGNKWLKANNLPITQFYHVSVDMTDPYHVYGGLQDNSVWVGDSAYPGGITNSRWENLYGGDGFFVFADPADPDYVYVEAQGGTISRVNRQTLLEPQHPAAAELRRKQAALQLEHSDSSESRMRRGPSISARSSCSARAITARPGTASRPTSPPTIRRNRSRRNRAASRWITRKPRCTPPSTPSASRRATVR